MGNKSRVTGRKFNRQDPNGRRHGPQKKKTIYKNAIEKVLNENNDWLSAEEISWKANKHISTFWTQLNTYSVSALLRPYVKNGLVNSRKVGFNTPKTYKRTGITVSVE